jgi:hypothetical protein
MTSATTISFEKFDAFQQARSRQEDIAATLVARGWGYRLPLRDHRCWQSIQLKASTRATGFIYVTREGEIRAGYTMRESRAVTETLRRQMLGEEE